MIIQHIRVDGINPRIRAIPWSWEVKSLPFLAEAPNEYTLCIP